MPEITNISQAGLSEMPPNITTSSKKCNWHHYVKNNLFDFPGGEIKD
jgi:hypothetical protein